MPGTTVSRHLCGHCNENLSKTVYYQHKRLYYDQRSRKWHKNRIRYDDTITVDAFVPTADPVPGPETSVNSDSVIDQSGFQDGLEEGKYIVFRYYTIHLQQLYRLTVQKDVNLPTLL